VISTPVTPETVIVPPSLSNNSNVAVVSSNVPPVILVSVP
jgi:hypothetical protein